MILLGYRKLNTSGIIRHLLICCVLTNCVPVLGGLLQILGKFLYSNKSVIRKKKWSLYMLIDDNPVGALFSDPFVLKC